MNLICDRKILRDKIVGAGGYTAVARMMEPPISRQAVWQWGHGTNVPVKRVKQVAEILGLDPKEIRPDIF